MVKDAQVKELMKFTSSGTQLNIAAMKSNMSEKTARKYRKIWRLPSQLRSPHKWRTRVDPFAEVWSEEVEPLLKDNPILSAKTLFHRLKEKYPDRFSDGNLRSIQRRIREWRIIHGDVQELFFPEIHRLVHRETSEKQERMMPFLITGDIEKFPYSHSRGVKEGDYYKLFAVVNSGKKRDRIKAISILAGSHRIYKSVICRMLGIVDRTLRDYISNFEQGGLKALFSRHSKKVAKSANPDYCRSVFEILHSPPLSHNINRTSWRLADIKQIMDKNGKLISVINIRKIIRNAGFRIRKAQKVLTSNDPLYEEKLRELTSVLSNLKNNECFFSIDEFGPLSVCIKGGSDYVHNGKKRIIPQWQKSKGKIIITAALELSTNQLTHFYSEKKNTIEMIKLLELLISKYSGKDKIYFSWDAASWHASKKLYSMVAQINSIDYRNDHRCPFVQLVPLPSSAQFLNVIESVFSGMARAIIHNSDYNSCDDCKIAINRYFRERNDHFQQIPAKAGKKIWGKELTAASFEIYNNCKDPCWR